MPPRGFLTFYLHCACGFDTQILAHMLDSLVRVSRRVNYSHFVSFLSLHHPIGSRGAAIYDTDMLSHGRTYDLNYIGEP